MARPYSPRPSVAASTSSPGSSPSPRSSSASASSSSSSDSGASARRPTPMASPNPRSTPRSATVSVAILPTKSPRAATNSHRRLLPCCGTCMTRLELLKIVIGRARANGFEFRRWYTTRLALPWTNAEDAIASLDQHRCYYTLLFSHEFAMAFWKPGAEITFQVSSHTFQRRMSDGSIQTVARKPFTRRSARKDAWRYHLREMALAEEPLRYIRRYLNVDEELTDDSPTAQDVTPSAAPARPPRKSPRPLPKDPPAFLRRPYP